MLGKFHVHVKANASESKIEDFGDNRFLVYVKSAPENNEANIEMLKMMGKHLGIPSTKIRVVVGATSKEKIVEVIY